MQALGSRRPGDSRNQQAQAQGSGWGSRRRIWCVHSGSLGRVGQVPQSPQSSQSPQAAVPGPETPALPQPAWRRHSVRQHPPPACPLLLRPTSAQLGCSWGPEHLPPPLTSRKAPRCHLLYGQGTLLCCSLLSVGRVGAGCDFCWVLWSQGPIPGASLTKGREARPLLLLCLSPRTPVQSRPRQGRELRSPMFLELKSGTQAKSPPRTGGTVNLHHIYSRQA